MAVSEREARIHAAHLEYGDRWEQMASEVSAFAKKHEIDLKNNLALQEITSLLCEMKYNPFWTLDEDSSVYP